jgi:small subunit ribosomal protein S17
MMDNTSKLARTLIGVVVSDKMNKTIVVEVERRIKHPVYGKYVRRTKNYSVHDENNSCKIGDTVRIKAHRPLSRTKSWILDKLIEQVV